MPAFTIVVGSDLDTEKPRGNSEPAGNVLFIGGFLTSPTLGSPSGSIPASFSASLSVSLLSVLSLPDPFGIAFGTQGGLLVSFASSLSKRFPGFNPPQIQF